MVSHSPRDDDATPDGRVALLLAAAAAPAPPGPQPGEAEALATFRASQQRGRSSMFSTPARTRVAVASTIGAGAFLFAGVGAAAAGILPGAAQDTASHWLEKVGVEVPGANADAGQHPHTRGASGVSDDARNPADQPASEPYVEPVEPAEESGPAEGKGAEVSERARTTGSEGADKGAEISGVASEGRSRAGAQHAPRTATATATPKTHQASPGRHAAGSGKHP